MRTAESVVLTCWPPFPPERYVSMRRSSGLMSMTIVSSISGETKTLAKLVWRRLAEVEGARCEPADALPFHRREARRRTRR